MPLHHEPMGHSEAALGTGPTADKEEGARMRITAGGHTVPNAPDLSGP